MIILNNYKIQIRTIEKYEGPKHNNKTIKY